VTRACDRCLRRGALIGFLSPQIAGVIANRDNRVPSLLRLGEWELIAAVGGSARGAAGRLLQEFDPEAARSGLDRSGSEAICRHAAEYPRLLREIHDPPNPLYVCGGVERLISLAAEPCVAMVGGRHPSDYARGVAQRLGRDLAAAGVTVVSGLALGIDAASHRGALAGGDAALAVLGRGLDASYPVRHTALFEQIVARGAAVSELMPGTRAWKWSFPARNRIMAALAHAVVVVEARESSGSLITADLAVTLHRDVAAIPGHVTARAAAGSNRLLQEGAAFVRGAEDVLGLVYGAGYVPPAPALPAELETPLRLVLDAVETGDSLHHAREQAELSASGLRAALGRLEALGLVRSDGLGGYSRNIMPGPGT
jgi:DNA processing protein